jgi:hypothetical protein
MAEQTQMLSHWSQHVEGLNQSTQQFYAMVEAAVEKRKIPDVKFSRVDFKEGGIFSSSREYLRIARGDLRYDICGAPYGNGFFVSSRLFTEEKFADRTLLSMAKGGILSGLAAGLTAKVVGAGTYMKVDSAQMYQQLVHRSVLEAIDTMTAAASLPPLPEPERKPVLKGYFQ